MELPTKTPLTALKAHRDRVRANLEAINRRLRNPMVSILKKERLAKEGNHLELKIIPELRRKIEELEDPEKTKPVSVGIRGDVEMTETQ